VPQLFSFDVPFLQLVPFYDLLLLLTLSDVGLRPRQREFETLFLGSHAAALSAHQTACRCSPSWLVCRTRSRWGTTNERNWLRRLNLGVYGTV